MPPTPAMPMEKPPLPPEVAAQGAGAPPFAQVGGMMGQQAMAGNPLTQAFDAVSKALDQMAKLNPKFAPFAQRMMQIGKAGLEESMGGKPDAPGAAPQGMPPGNVPG